MPAPLTIALLIPEPGTDLPWRESFQALIEALDLAGITARPVVWTAEVPQDCAAVLALLAWGYHEQVETWRARVAALAARRLLLNPAAVLLWNTDKGYLFDLERAGVAIVPTRRFATFGRADVAAQMAAFGTQALVIKPVVSASSKGIEVVRAPGDLSGERTEVLVQPYLASIETEGELSLLYVEGRFSHAVRKAPKTGEYRVQVQFGGTTTAFDPPAEAVALADAALAVSPEPPLYARVDMVRRGDGRWAIIELELIEPDLFLDLAPDRGRGFAEAVRARVEASFSK